MKRDLVREAFNRILLEMEGRPYKDCRTGYKELDSLPLIWPGAVTSISGKSAELLGMNLALQSALHERCSVSLYDYDVSSTEMISMMILCEAEVHMDTGVPHASEYKALIDATNKLYKAKIRFGRRDRRKSYGKSLKNFIERDNSQVLIIKATGKEALLKMLAMDYGIAVIMITNENCLKGAGLDCNHVHLSIEEGLVDIKTERQDREYLEHTYGTEILQKEGWIASLKIRGPRGLEKNLKMEYEPRLYKFTPI